MTMTCWKNERKIKFEESYSVKSAARKIVELENISVKCSKLLQQLLKFLYQQQAERKRLAELSFTIEALGLQCFFQLNFSKHFFFQLVLLHTTNKNIKN